MFSNSPDLSCVKELIGFTFYPYFRTYNSNKLQYKSSKYVYMGPSGDHKVFRCLSSSGHVYIVRGVVFVESEFPYTSLYQF